MFLLPVEDQACSTHVAEGDIDQAGSAALPEISESIRLAARVLRDQFGDGAAHEVDRRLALAMQDMRMEEAKHLWAVWLALRDQG